MVNEILGLEVPNYKKALTKEVKIDLYIGVFFDGTNNNKYQVMTGKLFRKKEIVKKHYDQLNKLIQELEQKNEISKGKLTPNNIITKNTRYFWENGGGKGIFTRSEIEYLYFGYGNINDIKDLEYNTFVEEKSQKSLNADDIRNLTSKPDDVYELKKLQEVAERAIQTNLDDGVWSDGLDHKSAKELKDKEVEGAPSQNSTYTNVAVLESLYKTTEIDNGDTLEMHVSLYIEGSGSDMQIESSKNILHKVSGISGLGTGTGASGLVSKVRKAVVMTNNLVNKLTMVADGATRELRIHFDICGFSRGAACARSFCYVINANPDSDTSEYDQQDAINAEDLELFTGKTDPFLPISKTIKSKEIRNLLIADTVSSIGVIDQGFIKNSFTRASLNTIGGIASFSEDISHLGQAQVDEGTGDISGSKGAYHYMNVDDYGLWATKLAKHVVHICAMDELRQNFALTDIENSLDKGVEIFIPGCHTDIGGGAAIGMESSKIINTGISRYLLPYTVHQLNLPESDMALESKVSNEIDDIPQRISVETLKSMGWLPVDAVGADFQSDTKTITGRSKQETDDTHYSYNWMNIVLYRHVYPGYSNIALNLSRHLASNPSIFNEIPPSYVVPQGLKTFYGEIIKNIDKSSYGRHFFYPDALNKYAMLRRDYLHFSSNAQLLHVSDNIVVNAPEYVERACGKKIIKLASRIIYKGERGVNKEDRTHMIDYENDKNKMIHMVDHSWICNTGTQHLLIAQDNNDSLPSNINININTGTGFHA